MKTKEEYYEQCLKNRELVNKPEIINCTCPNTLCEWHSRCKECVALHRHYGEHLPVCLQPMVKSKKFENLLDLIELNSVEREKIPLEYRQYVKEKDTQ